MHCILEHKVLHFFCLHYLVHKKRSFCFVVLDSCFLKQQTTTHYRNKENTTKHQPTSSKAWKEESGIIGKHNVCVNRPFFKNTLQIFLFHPLVKYENHSFFFLRNWSGLKTTVMAILDLCHCISRPTVLCLFRATLKPLLQVLIAPCRCGSRLGPKWHVL